MVQARERGTSLRYENFSGATKHVLIAAQEIAGKLGFETIKSEHILLGLLQDLIVQQTLMEVLHVNYVIMYLRIGAKIIPIEPKPEVSAKELSEEVEEIFRFAIEERGLNQNGEITPFHMLLAIMKQKTGGAREILEEEAQRNGLNYADAIKSLVLQKEKP